MTPVSEVRWSVTGAVGATWVERRVAPVSSTTHTRAHIAPLPSGSVPTISQSSATAERAPVASGPGRISNGHPPEGCGDDAPSGATARQRAQPATSYRALHR